MRVYVIDNYDSFVYNIVHILQGIGIVDMKVVKNDAVDFEELSTYDKILLSPGPGVPEEAGQLMEVIRRCHKTHSILGVCLGHQALGSFFGWELKQLETPLHGIASEIHIIENKKGLFIHFPENIFIGHYHSWIVVPSATTQNDLIITSKTQNEQVMSFQHQNLPIYGVQFHPESILTQMGGEMITNWILEK